MPSRVDSGANPGDIRGAAGGSLVVDDGDSLVFFALQGRPDEVRVERVGEIAAEFGGSRLGVSSWSRGSKV